MEGHHEARKTYGSDRAQLVYGLRPDGTLAHISKVQRGLACGCVCPACIGQLVARTKNDHQVPHFAHASGEACGGGPETALHLLAKDVFRANPTMLLPGRPALDKRKQVVTKPGQEVETEFLRLEYTDPKMIIPDLYVRALGYDLFVEVAVTHFSDDDKIRRLREHRTPAVEIDLSRLPRASTREEIADAVLRTAPRLWLFHPGIDAAETKRRADEQKRQAEEQKRQADARAKHDRRVNDLIEAYRTTPPHATTDEVPRLAELQAVGLSEHVGIAVAGIACFTAGPAVWQARILIDVFHDRCLGDAVRAPVPITNYLESAGFVRRRFGRVSGIVADDAASIEPSFAPPWKAVDAYLKHLSKVGVLSAMGYGFLLSTPIAERWKAWTLAETKRTETMHAAVQAVEWILRELPDDESGDMTGESWLESIDPESCLTHREALQSDTDGPRIAGELERLSEALRGRGPIPTGTVGLPVEQAIERYKIQQAEKAERDRQRRLAEAEKQRDNRCERLRGDLGSKIDDPEIAAFLNTKLASLNGMSPIESAADSEAGLSRAREAQAEFNRERARAVQRKQYQDDITAEAKARLAAIHVDAFLNGRDDDLGRMSPIMFVQDERTYQAAIRKLRQWENEFGRGP
ncbi:MAG: hypothetical protein KDK08_22565 [Rhizobiaceae bacterium]|nr:hypothetical protein [Rhizobiaceae bacterium]